MHAHLCLDCGAIIATGDFDCEYDADHDFALCAECCREEENNYEPVPRRRHGS